jgi:hypothetical protein
MTLPRRTLLFLFLVCWSRVCSAWGPHWHITRAGIDRLADDHPLAAQLGPELFALTNYCWIPDFKHLPFQHAGREFYCDDYLLFPGVTKHLDHICPEVQQAYEPYFRRALQALRMESPENAARWIGSLLHFVQDSGSPPHAARIRGDIHLKMENWIVASNITTAGYVPKLLGTNDDDAARGLIARMNGLIAFAKPHGSKLRTSVILVNRRAVAEGSLQCANECARVTADVLHTLGTLAARQPAHGFELSGHVKASAASPSAHFAPRLVIQGTNISTVTDNDGFFRLRGVSSGSHRISVITPGSEVFETNLNVTASMTNLVFSPVPSGNLVRNGEFASHWLVTNAPDCWMKVGSFWEGEVLALQPGTLYRIRAEFLTNSSAEVGVYWAAQQPFVIPKPLRIPRYQTQRLSRVEPEMVLRGSTNAALMLLTVRTRAHPTNEIRRISVTPLRE